MSAKSSKVLLALLALACTGTPAGEAVWPGPKAPGAEKPKQDLTRGVPALATRKLTSVPAATFGPYVGQAGQNLVFVWAQSDAAGRRGFYSAASSFDSTKLEAQRIGDVANELGVVTVRAFGGTAQNSASPTFAIISTRKQESGEVVEVRLLTRTGELLGNAIQVGESANAVLWVEAIALEKGALLFWAAQNANRAELFAVELGPLGELKDKPQSLVKDAGAWQVVPFASGAALGVVHASKTTRGAGSVAVLFIGPNARPSGSTVVSKEETAHFDFDMTRLGERLLLVWSDRRGVEARVYSAALDGPGKIAVLPAPATPAWGEQSVVRLVPPAAGADRSYLVWESLNEGARAGRVFDVAPFGSDGRVLAQRAKLQYWRSDGTLPELCAFKTGLSALTLAPICARTGDCANAQVAPTYVGFDTEMRVTASEPLRLEALAGKAASLGWGLTCHENECLALSALSTAPAPVFVTTLASESNTFRPAAAFVEKPPVPRAVENEALASTDPLAQISVISVAGQTLVGSITDFDPTTPWQRLTTPAPDGRFEPLRARIDLRAYSATPPHAPIMLTQNLSLRAHSVGGLALATPEPAKAEVLAAWAGLDRAQPQVFLTSLTKDGVKTGQRMLTRKNGGLSDVALAPTTDGYLVAWIDERDGDPELYATKVNRALTRVAPERRLTNVKGNATDLVLLPSASGALAIWADARDAEQAGFADLYALRLRGTDVAAEGAELRLTSTRTHSFGVAASPMTDAIALAWIEAADSSANNGAPSVALGVLKPTGEWLKEPTFSPMSDGLPGAVGLECTGDSCRVAVTVDVGGRAEIRGFSWKPGTRPAEPKRLVGLSTVSPISVAPVIQGKHLYFADTTTDREGRVRRLTVDWQ